MGNSIPGEENMARLVITSRVGQVKRAKRNSPGPQQPRNWLRQLGIVTASLVFLPVAIFSLAVFIGLFLIFVVFAVSYSLVLRSRLQRMESHQFINSDYEVVPDEDNQRKLLKEEGSAQQQD